jgi:hypothetical protein
VLAVNLAEFLQTVPIGMTGYIVIFVIVVAVIDIILAGALAKWAILAPVFVPLFMQLGGDPNLALAAYRVGLGMPQARCANAFVSRSVPGLCVFKEWTKQELDVGWKMFHALLTFWQLKNDHR